MKMQTRKCVGEFNQQFQDNDLFYWNHKITQLSHFSLYLPLNCWLKLNISSAFDDISCKQSESFSLNASEGVF